MSTTLRLTIARFFAAAAIALTLTSVGWTQSTEKILHTFTGSSDGSVPEAGMTLDSQGNLYGTTGFGGAFGCCGTVFELSPGANGTWTESVLSSFTGGADGGSLFGSSLIIDGSGNLYGTAESGGAYGYGV